MRKIYLASKSKQRQKLLKLLGLRFEVRPSLAKEEKRPVKKISLLVEHNALSKARAVAKQLKSGIIIGADTVVASPSGKIYGKPKNLKDAKSMLKKLSQNPQWVYTGIAVVDIDHKKSYTDYEKTKVFMQKLTDKEIDRYFSHISPLDKAGAFDIQDKGSIFISRIEGCFYNVVGLPLSKLYKLLKKSGISLLLVFLAFNFLGCATEYNVATQEQETLMFSTAKEIQMGENLSKQFEKQYKPVEDVSLQERVNSIGQKIASACDRKDLLYHFKVVEDKEVNAVSLPGGFIYVNSGLVKKVANDDELAGVIAHEVGHIAAKHSMKKLQALYGYSLLSILTAITTSPDFKEGVDIAFIQIFTGYSQEDEKLADKLAIKYSQKAGFDSQGILSFLEKLKEINQKEPLRPFSYWRTHPYISQRIAAVKEALYGRMEFKDYLNLDREEKK
jgi:MAF protein